MGDETISGLTFTHIDCPVCRRGGPCVENERIRNDMHEAEIAALRDQVTALGADVAMLTGARDALYARALGTETTVARQGEAIRRLAWAHCWLPGTLLDDGTPGAYVFGLTDRYGIDAALAPATDPAPTQAERNRAASEMIERWAQEPDDDPATGPVIHVLRPGHKCAPWGVTDHYWCGQPHCPGSATDGDGWSLNPMDATCGRCLDALLDAVPLPGPVAEAVDALRGVGAHFTADQLEAWATSLPAAPGDEARDAMREAADVMDRAAPLVRMGSSAMELSAHAGRLRALAGDAQGVQPGDLIDGAGNIHRKGCLCHGCQMTRHMARDA